MLLERTAAWPERMLLDVGAALHEGRTAEPNEDGEDYDACVGISYAPLSVESCGYRVVALPRRIGVREVARYAKPSCRRCHGLGYWAVERRVQAGTDESGCKVMQDIAYEQSCDCADKHFKQQHGQFLIDSQLGEWIALDRLSIEPVGDGSPRDGTLTQQDVQDAYEDVVHWPERRPRQVAP
jgi:hypothetical protein